MEKGRTIGFFSLRSRFLGHYLLNSTSVNFGKLSVQFQLSLCLEKVLSFQKAGYCC